MDERVPEVDAVVEEPTGSDVVRSRTMELIRQSIRYAIVAVLVTLAALWFLGKQRNLIGYLILSALLALALEPAVIWLHEKRGWRRGSATGLLLVAVFVVLVLLGIGLAAVLAREANQIVDQLPTYIDKLNAFTRDHFDFTVFSASQRAAAADAGAHLNEFLKDHQDDILGGIASGVSAIFTVFTIGLFTFYLTAQGPQVRRALLSRMPPERQDRILFAWEVAIKKMGGYLYSRLLLVGDQRRADVPHPEDRGRPVRPAARGASRGSSPNSSRSSGRTSAAPCRSSSPSRNGAHRHDRRAGRDRDLPAGGELLPQPPDRLEDDRAQPRRRVRRRDGGWRVRGVRGRVLRAPDRRHDPDVPVHLLHELRGRGFGADPCRRAPRRSPQAGTSPIPVAPLASRCRGTHRSPRPDGTDRARSSVPTYVALLRGINVGGKNLIRMPALKACFEEKGSRTSPRTSRAATCCSPSSGDLERRR